MGQHVEIKDLVSLGDVVVVDTDRSFTGQDGQAMTPSHLGDGVPGVLAGRLFALDRGIDHVFVQQNQVTVRRLGGWDMETKERVADVISAFLRFYDEEE
jgi:hypothetical protein